jgi:hypothetical protein
MTNIDDIGLRRITLLAPRIERWYCYNSECGVLVYVYGEINAYRCDVCQWPRFASDVSMPNAVAFVTAASVATSSSVATAVCPLSRQPIMMSETIADPVNPLAYKPVTLSAKPMSPLAKPVTASVDQVVDKPFFSLSLLARCVLELLEKKLV